MAFITGEQTWALWTVLLAAAAFGLWAERTAWGARLSGAVVTILAAFGLSNAGVIPATAEVYQTVWTYLVPFAIPLLLFKADLRRILRETSLTFVAFVLGTMGTVVGAVAAYYFISVDAEPWRLAAVFSATYIGGPLNFTAAARAVGLTSNDVIAAGVAAGNLVLATYLLVLFTLTPWRGIRQKFNEPLKDRWGRTDMIVLREHVKGNSIHLPGITTALAVSAGICATGVTVAPWLGFDGGAILLITVISVLLATLMPGRIGSLSAAEDVGMLLMQILFAAIGASANVALVLKVGPGLFAFAALTLAIHFVFILVGGKLLRLSLPQIVIASNANIGGPGTAAAMAASRRWRDMIIPAVLCGALGYVVATFIGVSLGSWLR